MKIDALEAAILNKDPEAVVAALAEWDEQQREAAQEPFNVFVLAHGIEKKVTGSCELTLDHPDVVAKRRRDGIVPMSRKDANYDYEMAWIADLARYGISGLDHCSRWVCVNDYPRQTAQIMADRRPPWLKQWFDRVTHRESDITAGFLAFLYEHGLWSADDFGPVAKCFEWDLPGAIVTAPKATQKILRDIEACRELVYKTPSNERILFDASGWVPVIDWLSRQKLLDPSRLLDGVLDALHRPLNQTERNGAVILAKAIKAKGSVLAEHQPRWAGLVADSQPSVAGFAVQQLAKIQKAGLLDPHEAIAALPSIFSHKPKTHAKKAVEILAQIAGEESLRGEAVEAIASALMHSNKDVQKAALDALAKHLANGDDGAIESLRLCVPSIAATLQDDAEKLLARCDGESQEEETASPAPVAHATADVQQAAAGIPAEVRSRLRLDEAMAVAGRGDIDLTTSWTIRDTKILETAAPIRPIESLEELIEVTATAVEQCECPDTVERIISGIVRLYRDRPKSFKSMTESLRNRACADPWDRPQRGIVAGHLGSPFGLLIGAWLGVEPDEDDYLYLKDPIQRYLAALSDRVREGKATPLLSEATHAGGWIEPRAWIERLIQVQTDGAEVFEDDLVRSLLRLTPDGRNEALAMCESLTAPLRPMATAALGGDVKIDGAWTAQVWITAFRARDPWIDLSKQLSAEEQSVISDDLKKMPDVVYPAEYQWRVRERKANTNCLDLVDAWPTQEDRSQAESSAESIKHLLSNPLQANEEEFSQALSRIAEVQSNSNWDEFLTASLHHLPCRPAPAYVYPYMATQWPMKLDWYWCLATKGLSKRVESGSSVEEPYGRFLLPLLEQDQPLTQMAARALWIATVSKDGNSRSAAIEVWIAMIETDRIDGATLAMAIGEVSQGGWVKLNRIGEVLADVAAVSPLHAWVVGEVLDAYLASFESFPRGIAPLLDLLDECNERLGRTVSEPLGGALQQVKSGKAKSTAKSLLNRPDQVTSEREAAVAAALKARMARCSRFGDGRS